MEIVIRVMQTSASELERTIYHISLRIVYAMQTSATTSASKTDQTPCRPYRISPGIEVEKGPWENRKSITTYKLRRRRGTMWIPSEFCSQRGCRRRTMWTPSGYCRGPPRPSECCSQRGCRRRTMGTPSECCSRNIYGYLLAAYRRRSEGIS